MAAYISLTRNFRLLENVLKSELKKKIGTLLHQSFRLSENLLYILSTNVNPQSKYCRLYNAVYGYTQTNSAVHGGVQTEQLLKSIYMSLLLCEVNSTRKHIYSS